MAKPATPLRGSPSPPSPAWSAAKRKLPDPPPASGKLDVFINLPLKVLQSSPQAARVILGALLNAVYEARVRAGRLLFLLDEVARLGYMGILETAAIPAASTASISA